MNYIRESFYRKVAEKRFGLDEGFWDTAKEYGQTALSVGGSFLKRNVGKVLGGAGAALGGVLDYDDRRNQGHSRLNALGGAASTAIGGGLGALAGGAVGTAALPGAGTIVGGIAGGIGGAQGAATLYDRAVGNTRDEEPKLPPGSNAVTSVRPPNGGTKQKAAAAAAERDKQGLQASGAPKPNEVQGPPTATQAAGTEKNSLGITKNETDSAQKAREAAAATASGNQPKPGTPEHNDISAQRPGSPEIKQVQQNMKDDPRPGDKENLAATLAKPDISSGDESAGLNMNKPNYGPNKPAAQQQAAPPSVRPRPAPSPVSTADTGGDKYGSGNASAGFERGKYAAPDASDNSSGANELRAKQAAVDRGTSNLGESKSKYINESITFERFLRKNKYGKNF